MISKQSSCRESAPRVILSIEVIGAARTTRRCLFLSCASASRCRGGHERRQRLAALGWHGEAELGAPPQNVVRKTRPFPGHEIAHLRARQFRAEGGTEEVVVPTVRGSSKSITWFRWSWAGRTAFVISGLRAATASGTSTSKTGSKRSCTTWRAPARLTFRPPKERSQQTGSRPTSASSRRVRRLRAVVLGGPAGSVGDNRPGVRGQDPPHRRPSTPPARCG